MNIMTGISRHVLVVAAFLTVVMVWGAHGAYAAENSDFGARFSNQGHSALGDDIDQADAGLNGALDDGAALSTIAPAAGEDTVAADAANRDEALMNDDAADAAAAAAAADLSQTPAGE